MGGRALIRCAALLAVLALPVAAETLPARYDVTGVAADDTLNVRAAASAEAATVAVLPADATGVEVVALNPSGAWAQVNAGERAGWVSTRFLVRQPGADWTAMSEPLRCSGTEPFWDLAFSPRAPQTLYMLGEPDTTLTPDFESPPFGDPARVMMRHDSANGPVFSLVEAAACSDGMSDRAFGLRVTLFLKTASDADAAASALHGCCTLNPPG